MTEEKVLIGGEAEEIRNQRKREGLKEAGKRRVKEGEVEMRRERGKRAT